MAVISERKAILLLAFVVAVVDFSTAKTVHPGSTKKPCTKHKHAIFKAPIKIKTTPPLPSKLPTILPHIKTKTPCTKKHRHTEKPTTERSINTSLSTQEIQTTAKQPTKAPTTACKPMDCVLSDWSEWSSCSETCGVTGVKHRHRKIDDVPSCGGNCPYPLQDTKQCNRACLNGGVVSQQGCTCRTGYRGGCCETVNGKWSPWGEWSQCSKSCDGGIQQRMRTCDQPAPSNGGLDCPGTSLETLECNKQECPVNGGWNAWGNWSPCSKSCGEGRKFRHRQCSNPFPSNGGIPCIGLMMLTAKCQVEPCKIPVDGGWSTWLEWSPCSKTCGHGSRVRTRLCNNPLPIDGGSSCSGSSEEEEKCYKEACKVPGNGGSGAVGGMGKRQAKQRAKPRDKRSSSNHQANNPRRRLLSYENSDIIPNFDVFVQNHNEELLNGDDNTNVSGPWSSWSTCTTTCGAGQRFRTRACKDLANPCNDVPMEVQPCSMGSCTP